MSKKIKLFLSSLIIFGILLLSKDVQAAANASVSAGKTSLEPGQSTTVTVSVSKCEAWDLKIEANGGTLSGTTVAADSAGEEVSKQVMSATFKATEEGSYVVNLTGAVTGSDLSKQSVAKSVTITVKNKETNNNNDNDNDKGTTNNNTTNTNTNTTKPNTTTNTTKPTTETPKETELTFSSTSGTRYTTSSVNLRSSATTSGNNVIKSLKEGTEITLTSKSNSKKDGYYWYKVSADGTVGYIADTGSLTKTKPEEKKEPPVLKGLLVNKGDFSPSFNKNTTTYNVSIDDEDVNQVIISASPESGATAKITCNGANCSSGTVPINEGLNTVKIEVSKDGETNTYTIYIRKSIKEDEEGNITDEEGNADSTLRLTDIKITGYELSPEFDKDVYSYTVIMLEDDESTSLDIKAIASDENAIIEIVGNEELEFGENIITIMVKSADDKETKIYQIVVNKQHETTTESVNGNSESQKTKSVVAQNKVPVLIICALVLIAIVCIVLIIKSGKKIDDFEEQLEEDVNKNILETEIPEEAYETNQYLNELRQKDVLEETKDEVNVNTTRSRKGRRFKN